MDTINPIQNTTETQEASSLKPRGVGIRFLAFMIDMILAVLIFWPLMTISSSSSPCTNFHLGLNININTSTSYYGFCGLSAWLFVLGLFTYYILFEWLLSGTIGKLILRIKVVNSNGEKIDFKASLIRTLLRIIDFLPFLYFFGAICIWTSSDKQRIGDRVAKTLVVSK